MLSSIKESVEYQLICEHYGDAVAKRSQVPLINHIDEGLIVLEEIQASREAMLAFCLHPMVQADDDCEDNYERVSEATSAAVLGLAMEYRSVANEYLSNKINTGHIIRLSALEEVNDMLIADKVQNRKDFYTYHYDTHLRSPQLAKYFDEWLDALDIDDDHYAELCVAIEANKVFDNELQELRYKVNVYETVFHNIQMNASVTMHPEKVSEIIRSICDWSYSQRSGNGELTEDEQEIRIKESLLNLAKSVGL